MFPEIHLWCYTCWPLGGQHGCWADLFHILAKALVGVERETSRSMSESSTNWAMPTLLISGMFAWQPVPFPTWVFQQGIWCWIWFGGLRTQVTITSNAQLNGPKIVFNWESQPDSQIRLQEPSTMTLDTGAYLSSCIVQCDNRVFHLEPYSARSGNTV